MKIYNSINDILFSIVINIGILYSDVWVLPYFGKWHDKLIPKQPMMHVSEYQNTLKNET